MRALPVAAAVLLGPSAPALAADASIEFGGYSSTYRPATVRILPAEQVTWAGVFLSHPLRSARTSEPYSNDAGSTFAHTFSAAGVYRFYCNVHGFKTGENEAGGMSGTVLVTANTPPSASFTATPETVDSGSTIAFDASASADAQGPVTYAWDLDGDNQYDDATGVTADRAFTAPDGQNKSYTVRLRVTDGNADEVGPESATATRTVIAHGAGAPPPPPPGDPPPAGTDPPPGPGGSDPDTRAPGGVLSGRRLRARGGRVRVPVSTDEPATVDARLTRSGKTLASGTVEIEDEATLRLSLTRAGRRALRGGRRVKARLRLTFTDAAGNAATVRRRVTVRR